MPRPEPVGSPAVANETVGKTDPVELIATADDANARVGVAHRELLSSIRAVDRHEAWRGSGARDAAHWVSMRYGLSMWKAHRWIGAAHELERLPRLTHALADGVLGIDKVIELCRFCTPDDEAAQIAWATKVSCAAVRRRGDLAARPSIEDDRRADRERFLSWWWLDEGRRLGLEAELPAAQGAIVVRALERVAGSMPCLPDEDDPCFAPARRADALVALCSNRLARDADPDRATVVIHARAEGLASGTGGCEIEGGPVIHPRTVQRLLCNARTQTVVEDEAGEAIGMGRLSREPSRAMLRQLRYRDQGCRFPGCGTRAFTEAHHIVWWRHGGRTDLDNLLLICSFHHRLVHEHGWSIRRGADGIGWRRPDGEPHRPWMLQLE